MKTKGRFQRQPLRCASCPLKFGSRRGLERHRIQCRSEKVFECQLYGCDKRFATKKRADFHQANEHFVHKELRDEAKEARKAMVRRQSTIVDGDLFAEVGLSSGSFQTDTQTPLRDEPMESCGWTTETEEDLGCEIVEELRSPISTTLQLQDVNQKNIEPERRTLDQGTQTLPSTVNQACDYNCYEKRKIVRYEEIETTNMSDGKVIGITKTKTWFYEEEFQL